MVADAADARAAQTTAESEAATEAGKVAQNRRVESRRDEANRLAANEPHRSGAARSDDITGQLAELSLTPMSWRTSNRRRDRLRDRNLNRL